MSSFIRAFQDNPLNKVFRNEKESTMVVKQKQIWPNFFIVGASKSGTTTLYMYLEKIPSIYMSPVKEPSFFATSLHKYPSFRSIKSKEEYLDLFKDVTDEKIIGEASPGYLKDKKAPFLIHKQVPEAKIAMILRNPIERAYSAYFHLVNHDHESLSFGDIIRENFEPDVKDDYKTIRRISCVKDGMYADYVKRYFYVFGKEQVKVIIFDDLVSNPKETIADLLSFLDISYDLDKLDLKAHNTFFVPRNKLADWLITNKTARKIGKRVISQKAQTQLLEKLLTKRANKPPMSEDDRVFLENMYKNDIRKLESLLEIKLPWSFNQN